MTAADGAAAGRKPWRYYYVMAFPLGSSSGITQDKLQEMTDMTAGIEQREEEYLRKVAARNTAHRAAMEAERRAAQGQEKPSMASHVAWVLRRLYAVSVLLLLLLMAVGYVLYLKGDGGERVPPSLARAATISAVVVLVVNIGGWVAAWRCSANGARVLLVVGLALVIGLAFLLDGVNLVRRSHNKLQETLNQSGDALTQDAIDFILNGGTEPSFVQRFVFDAPSEFLRWLSMHCANSTTTKLGYESVAIDRREFFASLWDDSEKTCVATTVRRCIRIDEVIHPILVGELVMALLQVLFTGVFLAVCDPVVAGKASKRRRQLPLPKTTSQSLASASSLSTRLTHLLLFGTAMFGSSNAIASTDLLHFCSIADFHELFTWIIVVCLLSGLSALIAALFIGCGWKQQLAGVLLILAVAAEVFMLAEFIKMAARLIGPDITEESDHMQVEQLREVYIKASAQTCSSIKRWISHVCVGMGSGESSADFDLSCQHEFVALLLASFNFTNSYLAWSIGAKLVLLVQLILPFLLQAVANVVSYVCTSSRDDLTVKTTECSLQQASPPLDYDEALEGYLTSIKVKDPARIAVESKAFEKEWSVRTGRMLSDVRTPRVVVTASDFGAIVRTLILRRLTAVCKLDVSLSVSNDGRRLLVRIFASDNLLLATLCETETYRLQFADAIDPGRAFWRDRKEINADQKVLDANTAKHKLKLLLAENAIPPKEAVWFPGESLARVSARVHALSRIARASRGLIRCRSFAPAFASYSPSIQRQFIYKKYPNKLDIPDTYRRSAVLRTVDCIRVTRRIINAEFDTNAALKSGLISSFHCLHSSSQFDLNSRGALASSWITFWRPVHLPGEFWPHDHAILNFVGRIAPFRQPLQDVRDYFGRLIALYFAWLTFYAKMMTLPAIAALVVIAIRAQHSPLTALWIFFASPRNFHPDNANVSGDVDKIGDTISLPELVLGLGVIAWSFAFIKLWERQSVWYHLQWGVAGNDAVSNADSFHSNFDHGAVHKQSMCSEIASLQRQLWSWLTVVGLGSANLLVVLTMLLTQGVLADVWGDKLAVLSSCVCQAFLVQWNSACIPSVAQALTRWENSHYSTDHSAYWNSVVAKLFTLQLFNTFTGLILLMLSSVGGLALLVRVVAPLRPLYASYNARVEGQVGIFIQMETLLIALFAAQLCVRVFLILSAVRRFGAIQRGEQRCSRTEYEEEAMLSPYPGPHKDYAQLLMQLGLVVMFSSVCPLLPLLALVDCAVKLRQNALELCCIRQRPEPEGVEAQGSDEDDFGLGPWAPCVFITLKLSVLIALALALFTADNYDDISIERRVGWWLVGALGIWLMAQLLWFLVPGESRLIEEARARNAFLVERYFGHAEIHEQKTPPREETRDKCDEKDHLNLQEPAPSVEQSLHHFEERLQLLQRLNVALRRRQEPGGSSPLHAPKSVASVTTEENRAKSAEVPAEVYAEGEEEGGYQTGTKDVEVPVSSSAESEALQPLSESSEEMIVGYFRPLRSTWPPPAPREGEVEEFKEAPAAEMVESVEEPLRLGTPPVSEMKRSDSGDEGISGRHAESGGGRPAPMGLSKIFKRVQDLASSGDDIIDSSLLSPPTSPFVSSDTWIPQTALDPGIFAPTELTSGGDAGSHEDEFLEEKREAPQFKDEGPVIPIATHSQIEAGERALLRQFSPRLSFLSRKPKRSSSKASDSKDSKSSMVEPDFIMPKQPAPRRLSKLFKRVQPPSAERTPPPEPTPPVVTNISAFERTETEERTINPVASLRAQFDFLSDAHAERTTTKTSVPMRRRRSSGSKTRPLSPPPVYTKIDLSGLEAVHEAASRRQFDFSADEQVWEE